VYKFDRHRPVVLPTINKSPSHTAMYLYTISKLHA
jgi:hypothetical protein